MAKKPDADAARRAGEDQAAADAKAAAAEIAKAEAAAPEPTLPPPKVGQQDDPRTPDQMPTMKRYRVRCVTPKYSGLAEGVYECLNETEAISKWREEHKEELGHALPSCRVTRDE